MVTAGDERADACFVVRPRPDDPAPLLLVLATTTWNAYNDWGGPSLYTGGTRVSFERPFAKGFLVKPEPVGRMMQTDARPRGDGLSELGAAAGSVRLERRRRMVELGTAVPALGGVERLPGGRRDVARPRGAPRGPARVTG